MAMDGSDSHGDGHTLAECFGPDFKEYVLKEQLKWSLYKHNSLTFITQDMWVFWSEQDHEIEPSLSLDNCADFNLNVCAIPKVTDNIRLALQKFLPSDPVLYRSLFQFWAATTTSEGRTLVTTQNQPFALGPRRDTIDIQLLCEYRMKMCSSEYNNRFYADAESGEEQLGLPGRVFLHQFPEATPYVQCYSTKEYPQRDLAVRCEIKTSWAVPVFEHSSQTCVGVLEMVLLWTLGNIDWPTNFFFNDLNKIFQEHGLQCFDGRQACEAQLSRREIRVKGLTQAFKELKTVLRSVCESHKLPLAMTWVPCSDCNGLGRCKFYSAGVEFCLPGDSFLGELLKASKCIHLRKGLVAGRARSSLNMLYCPDITQLSLHDYPLVHHARQCNLSGWFTICLLCKHTGNFIYVLEFFLSARSKDDEKTTLSLILGTIEEKFTTFRFASGKELGELIPVEVIHFQENQKIHSFESIQATREFSMSSIPSFVQSSASVANIRPGSQDACMFQSIQATRDFSMSSIPSSVQSSASVANIRPGSQDACMGTINAKYDSDSNPSSDFDHSFEQSSTSVANTRPGFQNANMVIIIAKYASIEEVFKLSLPCTLVELQQEVTKRLMLEAGTYSAIYEDEEDGPVLIACDEDLQTYVNDSMSHGNTPRVVLLS